MGEVRNLDASSRRRWRRLNVEPNVHFLSSKPHEMVPRYIGSMDVNVMCYRLADDLWVEAIYPLKLHEYLAAGRPVVSADVPSIRPFGMWSRSRTTPQQWENAIEIALTSGEPGSTAARRAVAAANSWTARVRDLESELSALATRNGQKPEPIPFPGKTTMSSGDQRRGEILSRVATGALTLKQAAQLLGVSYRHAKRLSHRFQHNGSAGLVHGHTGHRSNRAMPVEVRDQALEFIRRKGYEELGPTLAAAALASEEG